MSSLYTAFINKKPIKLKFLTSAEDRKRGFQFCDKMPEKNEGLFFIFDDNKQRNFHMRNVPFDLDLLCFDETGELVYKTKMLSGSENLYSTPKCKYAIEFLSGWALEEPIGSKLKLIKI